MLHFVFSIFSSKGLEMLCLYAVVVFPVVLCAIVVDPSLEFTADGVGSKHVEGFGVFGGSYGGYLGDSFHNLGDINGDGIDDMAMGEPGYDSSKGRVIVTFGNSSGLPSMSTDTAGSSGFGFHITIGEASSYLGFSVSGGGDYNGDGVNDILVGAYGKAQGILAVIWGKAESTWVDLDLDSLDPAEGVLFNGESSEINLGYSVKNIGDFNNDSRPDFMVSAPGYTDTDLEATGMEHGAVYVVYGKDIGEPWTSGTLNNTNSLRFVGEQQSGFMGKQIDHLGDINGDSVDDIIMANPSHEGDTGIGYSIFGASHYGVGEKNVRDIEDKIDGLRNTGMSTGNKYGLSVGGGCDMNNDGIDEILSGMNSFMLAAITYGRSTSWDDIEGVYITPDESATKVVSIGCLGDLDGDGYDDIYFATSTKNLVIVYGSDKDVKGDHAPMVDIESLRENGIRSVIVENATHAVNMGNFWRTDGRTLAVSYVGLYVDAYAEAGAVYVLENFPVPDYFTETPTESPSLSPSAGPTFNPTSSPTAPTSSPSGSPTLNPTDAPTTSPTESPTLMPSTTPTDAPTGSPTVFVSSAPTLDRCDLIVSTT